MDRFWNKVDQSTGPAGCWLWTACIDTRGYGLFRWHGRMWKAHRFALVLSGRLPCVNQEARHYCDTARCCNPAHLDWGSHQENMDDRQARGRWVRGRGNQRLTTSSAAELRARFHAGEPRPALAQAFGISVPHVYKVGKGTCSYV